MLPPMSLPPLPVFFGKSTVWMFGRTPPAAIVTVPNNLLNSSSFRTASWMCRGTIRFFLLSLAAFPASSRTCRRQIIIQQHTIHIFHWKGSSVATNQTKYNYSFQLPDSTMLHTILSPSIQTLMTSEILESQQICSQSSNLKTLLCVKTTITHTYDVEKLYPRTRANWIFNQGPQYSMSQMQKGRHALVADKIATLWLPSNLVTLLCVETTNHPHLEYWQTHKEYILEKEQIDFHSRTTLFNVTMHAERHALKQTHLNANTVSICRPSPKQKYAEAATSSTTYYVLSKWAINNSIKRTPLYKNIFRPRKTTLKDNQLSARDFLHNLCRKRPTIQKM